MSDDETRSAEEQVGREFLLGLLAAAGVAGSVEVRRDDNVSELAVSGDSLGFLIGPRGATLSAIQALTRAVAQRDHERGEHRLVELDDMGARVEAEDLQLGPHPLGAGELGQPAATAECRRLEGQDE